MIVHNLDKEKFYVITVFSDSGQVLETKKAQGSDIILSESGRVVMFKEPDGKAGIFVNTQLKIEESAEEEE